MEGAYDVTWRTLLVVLIIQFVPVCGDLYAGGVGSEHQADQVILPDKSRVARPLDPPTLLEFALDGGFNYASAKPFLKAENLTFDWSSAWLNERLVESPKAFWIDVYNMAVIQGVLQYGPEHLESVMHIEDFFSRSVYPIGGENLSLNAIEKQRLYQTYPDARLHFALVCAAQSCPPLYDEPFSDTDDLDRLLDSLTAESINDTLFVQFDHHRGEVLLSKLFDWYQKDYEKDAGSVLEFIAKYHQEGDALLQRTWKKNFRDYDWSLNQRPKRSE